MCKTQIINLYLYIKQKRFTFVKNYGNVGQCP